MAPTKLHNGQHHSNGKQSTEKFIKVQHEDMGRVIQLLKERFPKSAHVYNCAVRLSRHPGEFGLYALDGDLSTDAWIVVVHPLSELEQTIDISAPPNVQITDYIKQAFIDTEVIDWKKTFKFSAVDRTVSRMITEISIFVEGTPTLTNPNFAFYYVPIEEALKLEIPSIADREEARALDIDEGARFVTSHWKYTKEGSLEYAAEVIKRNPSYGIYVNGKPASGVVTHSDIFIGLLATDPKHRNKGYAQICMKTLIRELAREDYVPTSCVEHDNETSKNFHAKCGMLMSHECDFIFHR